MNNNNIEELTEEYRVLKEMYDQLLDRHAAAQNFIDRVSIFFDKDGEISNGANLSAEDKGQVVPKPDTESDIVPESLVKLDEQSDDSDEEFHNARNIWSVSEDEEIEHLATVLKEVATIAEHVKSQSKLLVKKAAKLC